MGGKNGEELGLGTEKRKQKKRKERGRTLKRESKWKGENKDD
jgi:hypothetical protein